MGSSCREFIICRSHRLVFQHRILFLLFFVLYKCGTDLNAEFFSSISKLNNYIPLSLILIDTFMYIVISL